MNWFDSPLDLKHQYENRNSHIKNPMVRKFGERKGYKCKVCKFLTFTESSNKYYKCKLRGITKGPGTDHRKNWPACNKIEFS